MEGQGAVGGEAEGVHRPAGLHLSWAMSKLKRMWKSSGEAAMGTDSAHLTVPAAEEEQAQLGWGQSEVGRCAQAQQATFTKRSTESRKGRDLSSGWSCPNKTREKVPGQGGNPAHSKGKNPGILVMANV